MRRSPSHLVLVAIFVLHACGSPVNEPASLRAASQPIFYGSPDTNPAHAAVVALTDGPDSGFFCSGTLIRENVVLTAAHCLQGVNPSQIEIYFGQDVNSGVGYYREVDELLFHDDFDSHQLTADIGIIRLAGLAPPGITPILDLPAELGLTTADEGEAVEFSGFGVTETGSDGEKLRVDGTIDEVCTGPYACNRGQLPASAFFYRMDAGGPCSGDSGGPTFLMRDGQEFVAGVTSYGDYYCAQYGVNTSVSGYATWIDDFIAAGGYEDCANGVDDDQDDAVDCDDSNCDSHVVCMEENACDTPVTLGCWATVDGYTGAGSSVFMTNGCATTSESIWGGPEVVYALDLPEGAEAKVRVQPTSGDDLDIFLLPELEGTCDLQRCQAASHQSGDAAERLAFTMPAEPRYLLVETFDHAGPFILSIECPGVENCISGDDEDDDGDVDCDDSDCDAHPECYVPPERCDNDADDDGDGAIDCDDSDCNADPTCQGDPGGDPPGGCNSASSPGAPSPGLLVLLLIGLAIRWR